MAGRRAALAGLGLVLGLAGLGLAAGPGSGPAAEGVPAALGPGSGREVTACLRAPHCSEVFVAAHRARGFGAPENSVAAIEAALAHGVRVVKLDLRAARDGEVFVLHDPTLDRTTDHHGPIAEHSAEALRVVRLANGEPLPRFVDLYRRVAGRALLVLDCKADVMAPVVEWLHAHGSLDDAVFLVGTVEAMRELARIRAHHPTLLVAARLVNWWDLPVMAEIFGGTPDIIHTDLTTPAGVAEIRRRAPGAKVFVKALDVERRIWPFGRFAVQDIVGARPELILTAQPTWFQRQLASRDPGAPAR
jgi:glycerophosphoryl diester phosphodiesterase